MSSATPKQRLRDTLLERRLAIEPTQRIHMEQQLSRHLEASPLWSRFRSVAGYVPMRGEVDIRSIMTNMASCGLRMSLPCIEDNGRMAFRRWQPGDPLKPGRHRIPAPMDGEEIIPELILLPLLGCDLRGYRLGAGGGYYDRTLSRPAYRDSYCLGVGFSFQRLPLLPSEAHDVRLHAFLSETGITEFEKTS